MDFVRLKSYRLGLYKVRQSQAQNLEKNWSFKAWAKLSSLIWVHGILLTLNFRDLRDEQSEHVSSRVITAKLNFNFQFRYKINWLYCTLYDQWNFTFHSFLRLKLSEKSKGLISNDTLTTLTISMVRLVRTYGMG